MISGSPGLGTFALQVKIEQFHLLLHINVRPAVQAPLVPDGVPVVNALAKQRAMLENILRACVGLPPENHLMQMLEFNA